MIYTWWTHYQLICSQLFLRLIVCWVSLNLGRLTEVCWSVKAMTANWHVLETWLIVCSHRDGDIMCLWFWRHCVGAPEIPNIETVIVFLPDISQTRVNWFILFYPQNYNVEAESGECVQPCEALGFGSSPWQHVGVGTLDGMTSAFPRLFLPPESSLDSFCHSAKVFWHLSLALSYSSM